jgi:hypothetical protein
MHDVHVQYFSTRIVKISTYHWPRFDNTGRGSLRLDGVTVRVRQYIMRCQCFLVVVSARISGIFFVFRARDRYNILLVLNVIPIQTIGLHYGLNMA